VVTVSMMQPGLFPWFGVFEKIALSDVVVHLDHVAWQKGGHLNRFRLLDGEKAGWCTLRKVRARMGTPIQRLLLHDPLEALDAHSSNLIAFSPSAPHIADALTMLADTYHVRSQFAAVLAIDSIERVSSNLGLRARHVRSSVLAMSESKSAMILSIARKVGADAYLFGPGRHGLVGHYLDLELLRSNGLRILVAQYSPRPRRTILQDLAYHGFSRDRVLNPRWTEVLI